MVNKEKAIKRELTRLRKTQNPEQIDFRRMRKLRAAKTSLWKLKRKHTVAPAKVSLTEKKKKKVKPAKKPKKKEPELEILEDELELEVLDEDLELEEIEEEPELEEISEDLEDLYSYDEDIDEEDFEEEDLE
ncbi:MAG: hypothetical protein AM325_000760 [Candidatus Thorarchaeota archaeon SMTZ1-45]|nr:MAG: hypothetical protein AM325_02145 [Candidatus Thorarchaeota archaeon SMTZ1-45]